MRVEDTIADRVELQSVARAHNTRLNRVNGTPLASIAYRPDRDCVIVDDKNGPALREVLGGIGDHLVVLDPNNLCHYVPLEQTIGPFGRGEISISEEMQLAKFGVPINPERVLRDSLLTFKAKLP